MDQAQHRDVDVLVVGAGLAGLTAAATAARSARSVALLDVRSPGGRARSDERDGYILNQGPRALFRTGPGAGVLADLGLAPRGAPPARRVAGWRHGELGVLPTTAGSLARSAMVGWRSKARLARLLATFPRVDAAALAPLSAAAWVRSLGLPDDAADVVRTLLRVATYAPDLEVIAADAAVRQLQLAQTGGVSYLDGGWAQLVDGLLALSTGAGTRVVRGERAESVQADDRTGRWDVVTSAGTWSSRAVVVATGSPAAAAALLPSDPCWALGEDATAACLDLGLRKTPPIRACFGIDQPLYLSTHAPSAKLAPEGAAVVHVMRYGVRSSEEDRASLWEFAGVAGIGEDDVVVERYLHRMVVSHAQPAPGLGLAGRPPCRVSGRPGLFVAGDWVGPTGLLADASLSSGQDAGRAAASVAGAAPPASGPATPAPATSAIMARRLVR